MRRKVLLKALVVAVSKPMEPLASPLEPPLSPTLQATAALQYGLTTSRLSVGLLPLIAAAEANAWQKVGLLPLIGTAEAHAWQKVKLLPRIGAAEAYARPVAGLSFRTRKWLEANGPAMVLKIQAHRAGQR